MPHSCKSTPQETAFQCVSKTYMACMQKQGYSDVQAALLLKSLSERGRGHET